MKIAQVSQHYRPIIGGQEVYIEGLQQVVRSAGYDSKVIQIDRGVHAEDNITVPRINGLGRIIPEPYLFNLAVYLTSMKQLTAADLIIAHYAFSAIMLGKFSAKTIILSHGVEWHLENMTWDDRVHEWAARRSLNEFPHVVNDTHYLRHLGCNIQPATGFFTEVAPRKWFIPNCVDTRRFSQTEGIPELKARNIILVPRQVAPDRGIDLAIKAFRQLDNYKDFTLYIAGKQRAGAYLNYCFGLVKSLGLEKYVTFKDHTENREMPDYYSSAVLTVIPTLRREGTSLSALESMACGTATLSTNVAGLRDLPTVQAEPNEADLAKAMSETIANGNRVGEAQRDIVQKEFNIENWSKAWLKVIETVAKS